MQVTQVSPEIVPLVLAIFGIGMTVGNIVVPKLADHALMPTIGGVLIWSAATTALFSFTASSLWGISITVFFIGMGGALGRSEEHTSELQSLMRISYAVFCLKKKKSTTT